jgi:hypothetical protein
LRAKDPRRPGGCRSISEERKVRETPKLPEGGNICFRLGVLPYPHCTWQLRASVSDMGLLCPCAYAALRHEVRRLCMAAPPAARKRTHNFAGRNSSFFFSSYTNSGYTMGTSPPFIGHAPTAVYNTSQWSLRRTILYIQEPVIMRPDGPLVRDRGASLRAYRCILYSMLYSNGTGGFWSSCWAVVLGSLCAFATGRYRLSSLRARRS